MTDRISCERSLVFIAGSGVGQQKGRAKPLPVRERTCPRVTRRRAQTGLTEPQRQNENL